MNGVTEAGTTGWAPAVAIQPCVLHTSERVKYERMWKHEQYRLVSPGEHWASTFLQQSNAKTDDGVIDFGCGTGRGGLMLALLGAMKVQMLDFAENCLDQEVADTCVSQPTRMSFALADLTQPIVHHAIYGFCCDVMEHIPTQDVPRVLRNILDSAQHCFFGISCVPDAMGVLIGEQLHLTVKPASWWIDQLTKLGAIVHWSEDRGQDCAIYCSGWTDAEFVLEAGRVNVEVSELDAQIAANIKAGWRHATPYDKQDREVILLAGGPSMSECLPEIRELRGQGHALVTVNGAYHWAIEHDLQPSVQIVLDARAFNARFTKPVVPGCKYMVASQVHPSALDGMPWDMTYLWHSGLNTENEALAREKTTFYYPVPGGSTVILRAIPLLRMLGLWHLHIFGFDSCLLGDKHHAYAQAENDNELHAAVSCGGKVFQCTSWMISQAREFQDVIRMMGDEVNIAVYGNGLIAHMLATSAALVDD